jgi:DNA-binding MarR family transcriptional regulator/ActR/RegA family two-component response regulator
VLPNSSTNDRAAKAETTVLLIDANAASLEFMARALSQRGTQVLTGDGSVGVEATLELLRSQPEVGVLVIDPSSLAGYSSSQTPDFVQRTAAVRPDLQIILVAEPPEFSRFTDTQVLEVADLLPKPLARGTLLRAVFEAQRRHATSRDPHGEAVVVRLPERAGLPRRPPVREISPDLRTLQLLADIDEFRCRALADVFETDATWSMLSELLRAQLLRRQISVTSLCLASRSPVTTALRRIERLQAAGLVSFNLDPKDRRRKYIELTAAGSARVTEVIRGVARRLGDDSAGP